MRNGVGTYYWADGSKYIGQWKDDQKHGEGTEIDIKGQENSGKWENGKKIS